LLLTPQKLFEPGDKTPITTPRQKLGPSRAAMLVFAFAFFALAIFVLTVKKPARPPYESPEYQWDDRVVASVLVLMAAGFALAHWFR
jgi:hypothetical protein